MVLQTSYLKGEAVLLHVSGGCPVGFDTYPLPEEGHHNFCDLTLEILVEIPSKHSLRSVELKKLDDYLEIGSPVGLRDVVCFRMMKLDPGAGERKVCCIFGSCSNMERAG